LVDVGTRRRKLKALREEVQREVDTLSAMVEQATMALSGFGEASTPEAPMGFAATQTHMQDLELEGACSPAPVGIVSVGSKAHTKRCRGVLGSNTDANAEHEHDHEYEYVEGPGNGAEERKGGEIEEAFVTDTGAKGDTSLDPIPQEAVHKKRHHAGDDSDAWELLEMAPSEASPPFGSTEPGKDPGTDPTVSQDPYFSRARAPRLQAPQLPLGAPDIFEGKVATSGDTPLVNEAVKSYIAQWEGGRPMTEAVLTGSPQATVLPLGTPRAVLTGKPVLLSVWIGPCPVSGPALHLALVLDDTLHYFTLAMERGVGGSRVLALDPVVTSHRNTVTLGNVGAVAPFPNWDRPLLFCRMIRKPTVAPITIQAPAPTDLRQTCTLVPNAFLCPCLWNTQGSTLPFSVVTTPLGRALCSCDSKFPSVFLVPLDPTHGVVAPE